MKLHGAQELRRNELLAQTAAKRTDAAPAPAKNQAKSAQRQTEDKCTLSRQALAFLGEQDRKRWEKTQEELQRKMDRSNEIISGLEDAKNQSEAMAEALKVLLRCQKIASSIIKGDNVPSEDMQYLMEHNADSYQMAMSLRRPKDDPDDCDSVLEDEDQDAGSAEGAEGAESGGGSPEAAAAAAEVPAAEAPAEA